MFVPHEFVPHEIVAIRAESRLYGEVIQVLTEQNRLWVRPLLLVTDAELHDLRATADLILPAQWFEPCLDTEAIPLLAQLETAAVKDTAPPSLRAFVRQVWQNHAGH